MVMSRKRMVMSRASPLLQGPGTANPDDSPVLEATGVTKTYRTGWWPRRRVKPVLRGADVQLWPGEVVGLVGENGSGKSTLMKILVGALDRDAGAVAHRGLVGFCPQEPVLHERLTCDEHFELFGRAYGMTGLDMQRSRDDIYTSLGFADWRTARVEELSGGPAPSSTSGSRCCPIPTCCCSTSPTPGSTGTPTSGSGSSPGTGATPAAAC